ncbi:hypothetical protein [Achromobacter insolitus]|uniref:hypothetical protein n=1 Tax=Achromobacter insolitus TaxID=217204 RepID=UPI0013E294E5|nr:hypothetical protein [Achromobacter insolitus]NGT16944.1 hypothetical protein [Achromobacter insolitus]
MKYRKLIYVVLAFILATALSALAAIGAVSLAVDDVKLRPTSSSDVASWIQAVAATLAILASAGLALYIQARDLRVKRIGSALIAADIALHAKTLLAYVNTLFKDRQRVYDIAQGTHPFDRDALEDLWVMISQLDLQAIQEPVLVRPLLLLRASVRKVRQTVDTALSTHREMDGAAFDTLFRILANEAAHAATSQEKIFAAAENI